MLTRRLAGAGIVLALLIGSFVAGNIHGHRAQAATDAVAAAKVREQADKAAIAAQEAARLTETALAVSQAAVAESYEKGKRDAKANADAVVAGLRAGTVQLRDQWTGCQADRARAVSAAGAASARADAAQRSREESAGRIVQATDQCDAQVTGLQNLILEYQRLFGAH